MVKQLRQVAGVDSVKVADFKRGAFAVIPRRGVRLSESALMAAARRSGFQPDRIVAPRSASLPRPSGPARTAGPEAGAELAEARTAFRQGDYDRALILARQAAKSRPSDLESTELKDDELAHIAEVQQFLSLAYFALGKYDDSSSAAYTALQRGEHWKWKTLGSHYEKTADYSAQLRALEDSIRRESTPEKRFLIGYHYLMLGQPRAARAQFARAAKDKPNDVLIANFLEKLATEKTDE